MPSPYVLLLYDYAPDVAERREPHRPAHLTRIAEWEADGRIAMAGAVGSPPTGAAIVFRGDDPTVAERFAAEDPYVLAGLVTAHRVLPYTVVTGGP